MDIFQSELSGLSKDNITRLHEMKERSEELKSAREEKRKQLAADLLYEQWKKNDPKLRQVLTLLQIGRPQLPPTGRLRDDLIWALRDLRWAGEIFQYKTFVYKTSRVFLLLLFF